MRYVSFAEQQGIEKGIEKGLLIGQIQVCQKYLKLAESPTGELAARPPADLSNLLTELEARLFPTTDGAYSTS